MIKTSKVIKGRIHVGRLMGSGPDEMRLELNCESSRVQFVEIRMSPGDLMLAMTGRMVECDMEVRALHLVGAIHEHKTEEIPFNPFQPRERKSDGDYDPRTKEAVKVLAPFEVDGWTASAEDLWNSHNLVERGTSRRRVRVSFHRWVNPETKQPILNT